jgi:expansin (peptidoglycan-binding protein)
MVSKCVAFASERSKARDCEELLHGPEDRAGVKRFGDKAAKALARATALPRGLLLFLLVATFGCGSSSPVQQVAPQPPDGTTVCDRIVPSSVSPPIACTPLPLGGNYDGCTGSNLACGPVQGCILERNEEVSQVVPTSLLNSPAGYEPPSTLLPPAGTAITGRGSGWFTRGDGTLAKGSCSFPAVKDIMVAALTSQQFGNADWCGACAEVVGRSGTRVRVEIVDQCSGCAPGGLDLAAGPDSPYVMLNVPGNPDTCRDGLLPITWKIVPCETRGGIVVHYVEGYSVYSPAVQIRNHRLPLVRLEEYYLGQWSDIPRTADNKYVLNSRTSPTSVGLPLTIRVTAIDGSTITGTFPSFVAGTNFEATSQY